jgi:hypothetical protein
MHPEQVKDLIAGAIPPSFKGRSGGLPLPVLLSECALGPDHEH